MKYLLLLEAFVRKEELKKNKALSYLYDRFSEKWESGFQNAPDKIKNQKEDILLWISKASLIYVRDIFKDLLNTLYNNDEDTESAKLTYDILRGKVEDFNDDAFFVPNDLLFSDMASELNLIRDYIFSPVRTDQWKLPLKLTLEKAVDLSRKWHSKIKASGIIEDESGDVLMSFKDNFYFIDLKTSACKAEGGAMGHCGSTSADTLISLRSKSKEPHVTIAMNKDGTIKQIKGKGNTKPIKKYHSYVVKFIAKYATDFEWEYLPEYDLRLYDLTESQLKYIKENNKGLEKSREFLVALLSKNMLGDDYDLSLTYPDIHRDEETEKIYYIFDVIGDIISIFEDGQSDYVMSHGYIEQIINGDVFELIEGYFDKNSFFMYDWGDVTKKTKVEIVKCLSDKDNIDATYNQEENEVYIDEYKLEDYPDLEYLETYNLIEVSASEQDRLSTESKAYSAIIDSMPYNINFADGKWFITMDMVVDAIKYETMKYEYDDWFGNYSAYLDYSEDLIEVRIPYNGFHGDFDTALFEEILLDRAAW